MAESKHTPGPWFVDPDAAGNVSAPKFMQLALIARRDRNEAAANAHLIAAAPELLAVAQETLDYLEAVGARSEGAFVLERKARAALSKARGETP